jgi:hypothetical protein
LTAADIHRRARRPTAALQRPPVPQRAPAPRPASPPGASTNAYLAYAEFRIAKHRAKPTSETFRYFRQTVHHSVLWMIVMRGHYTGNSPSLKQCINEVRISKDTARKIITDAQARGYLELRFTGDDKRKKLVCPTAVCIAEFESMVDAYWRLIQGF